MRICFRILLESVLSLLVILVLESCVSRYDPLLTQKDLEWVNGFTKPSRKILESSGGGKLIIRVNRPTYHNRPYEIHLNEGRGWSNGPGYVAIGFSLKLPDRRSPVKGWIWFEKDVHYDRMRVKFEIDDLGTPIDDYPPKGIRLIPVTIDFLDEPLEDCFIFKKGVNIYPASDLDHPIVDEVIISKNHGIISVQLVDGTQYVYREVLQQ